jgi:hypothetical protein
MKALLDTLYGKELYSGSNGRIKIKMTQFRFCRNSDSNDNLDTRGLFAEQGNER